MTLDQNGISAPAFIFLVEEFSNKAKVQWDIFFFDSAWQVYYFAPQKTIRIAPSCSALPLHTVKSIIHDICKALRCKLTWNFFLFAGRTGSAYMKREEEQIKERQNMEKNKGIGHKMFVHGRFLQSRYLCWGKLIEKDVGNVKGFVISIWEYSETECVKMMKRKTPEWKEKEWQVYFVDKRDTRGNEMTRGKKEGGKVGKKKGGEIRTGVKYDDCYSETERIKKTREG